MATETRQSDMGIGLGLLFSVLTVVGALAMFAGPDQLSRAWGFAAAMAAAALAVTALHVYE